MSCHAGGRSLGPGTHRPKVYRGPPGQEQIVCVLHEVEGRLYEARFHEDELPEILGLLKGEIKT